MGCQLHTLCEVLKRTDFLLVELAQNQLLTGCCARVSSVFYYVWLTKGQKGGFLLTLIERGSWMLLKSGGGLNQPALFFRWLFLHEKRGLEVQNFWFFTMF